MKLFGFKKMLNLRNSYKSNNKRGKKKKDEEKWKCHIALQKRMGWFEGVQYPLFEPFDKVPYYRMLTLKNALGLFAKYYR